MKRFWSKVDISAAPNGCFPWLAARSEKGYGRFKVKSHVTVKAHRYAYEITHGPVPPGKMVLHSCDNPPCCNPGHLYLGDAKQNAADRTACGRSDNGRQRADRNPRAKLTCEKVSNIRAALSAGATNKALGKRYRVHHSTISAIRRGKSWDYMAAK